MKFYCPVCWHDMPFAGVKCPRCGTDAGQFSSEATFVDKLLSAVFHPEPLTARRAIWILGEKQSEVAVPALAKLLKQGPDLYTLLAIVEALEKIGTPAAREMLQNLSAHKSAIVGREARGSLSRLRQNRQPAVTRS